MPATSRSSDDDDEIRAARNQTAQMERDLNERMAAHLLKNGVISTIKAQVRYQVVAELRQKVSGKKGAALAAGGKEAPVPIEEQGRRHLVLEFLLHRGFGCSAAVFSPEADVPSSAMAREDMLKILGISPSSSHFMKITGNSDPVLCQAMDALATASHQGEHNVAVQTDIVPLELRLQQIDQKHQYQRDKDDERGTMEERMREWERKTEERLRKIYEDDLARFKAVEVAKMRLEERAKHSAEVDGY